MFGGGQVKYDRALTVFSPEGRLFQVEYALEAVRRGTLAVAAKTKDAVCLAAQIKIPSNLIDADSIDKLFQVDEHIGVAISGLHADSRTLINYARVQAQSFRLTYDEPVRLNMLVKSLADIKQQYTQFGGSLYPLSVGPKSDLSGVRCSLLPSIQQERKSTLHRLAEFIERLKRMLSVAVRRRQETI